MNTSVDDELVNVKNQYAANGYAVRQQVFSATEVDEIKGHFMALQKRNFDGHIGRFDPELAHNDPLTIYPRVVHPHRWDELSLQYLFHPKVTATIKALMGDDALGVQTMFYFKPPGARGQALHQDQFYLMVQPGTCMAAWTAIDDCDVENGAMYVVPETQDAPISCPEVADASESFTKHFVPVPKGLKTKLVEMKAGDTLFFNGSLIHGSGPNRSKDRFRRSFIAHYASGEAESIAQFYKQSYHLDGRIANLEANTAGGPCGAAWQGEEH